LTHPRECEKIASLVTTVALGEGKTMLGRLGFCAALVTLLAVVVIPTAGASPPIREEVVFSDVTYDDFYLSDACGTTVIDTLSAEVSVAFFPAAQGRPAHEVDTLTHGVITYSSPDTGNSLTRSMNGTAHTLYPEGTAPGSPALLTFIGVNMSSLGTGPPGSGQLVANGTILFLDDLGVPVTTFDTSGIVSMRGNYAATTAEICAALT
jgi:hypothetical protein